MVIFVIKTAVPVLAAILLVDIIFGYPGPCGPVAPVEPIAPLVTTNCPDVFNPRPGPMITPPKVAVVAAFKEIVPLLVIAIPVPILTTPNVEVVAVTTLLT